MWAAQERARKALLHANKARERAQRALRPPRRGATPSWTAKLRTLSAMKLHADAA
jgi:hypothetical protein